MKRQEKEQRHLRKLDKSACEPEVVQQSLRQLQLADLVSSTPYYAARQMVGSYGYEWDDGRQGKVGIGFVQISHFWGCRKNVSPEPLFVWHFCG